MPLIQVALHWLSRNKGSELKTGWAIRGSGGESDAASFIASFEQYAVPFFQSVGRLDDLAELVLHMEEYPSNLPSTGFTSPDPINYLSIALFYAGQPERSVRLLDASLDEQYPRSIWKIIAKDPAYREVVRCRVRKVKSFLAGDSASPTKSPNTETGLPPDLQDALDAEIKKLGDFDPAATEEEPK